jgi:hypothetical protein
MQAIDLGRRGTVWGYTVQRFAPKSPPYVPPADGFVPFAVGYVELPEGVKVEARAELVLDSAEHEHLEIGIGVDLLDDLVEAVQQLDGDGVLLVRAVQPDAGDVAILLEEDVIGLDNHGRVLSAKQVNWIQFSMSADRAGVKDRTELASTSVRR